MHALALFFARPTWRWLIWLMRRRRMRAAQLWPARFLGRDGAENFRRRHYAQNRFARRIGLPMLVIAYELLIASLILNFMYQAALALVEGGYVRPPQLTREGR